MYGCFFLVLIHSATLCLLTGAFGPFTFNIIINRCILTILLLLVALGLFLLFFMFLSSSDPFPCDLIIIVNVMVEFLSRVCVLLLKIFDLWLL